MLKCLGSLIIQICCVTTFSKAQHHSEYLQTSEVFLKGWTKSSSDMSNRPLVVPRLFVFARKTRQKINKKSVWKVTLLQGLVQVLVLFTWGFILSLKVKACMLLLKLIGAPSIKSCIPKWKYTPSLALSFQACQMEFCIIYWQTSLLDENRKRY